MNRVRAGDHGVTEGRVWILSVSPAGYGQYDTCVFAAVEGGAAAESILRHQDCPPGLAAGQSHRVGLYRGLIAYFVAADGSVVDEAS